MVILLDAPALKSSRSWGFESVGRGEVVVTARWHYEEAFELKRPTLAASFMGIKRNKVTRTEHGTSLGSARFCAGVFSSTRICLEGAGGG